MAWWPAVISSTLLFAMSLNSTQTTQMLGHCGLVFIKAESRCSWNIVVEPFGNLQPWYTFTLVIYNLHLKHFCLTHHIKTHIRIHDNRIPWMLIDRERNNGKRLTLVYHALEQRAMLLQSRHTAVWCWPVKAVLEMSLLFVEGLPVPPLMW